MSQYTIKVRGIPAPQGSKNVTRTGHLYESSSKKLLAWRQAIKLVVLNDNMALGLTTPVKVSVVFLMPRPLIHYVGGKRTNPLKPDAPDWCATTPDIDKLLRSTYDALTQAGVIADDRLIVSGSQSKLYTSKEPGAIIRLRALGTVINRAVL